MIIIQGWVRLAPGSIGQVRAAVVDLREAGRKQPGCLDYGVAIDVADPDLLRINEQWIDEAALAAHLRAPYMVEFNAAIAGARLESASVKAFETHVQRNLIGD